MTFAIRAFGLVGRHRATARDQPSVPAPQERSLVEIAREAAPGLEREFLGSSSHGIVSYEQVHGALARYGLVDETSEDLRSEQSAAIVALHENTGLRFFDTYAGKPDSDGKLAYQIVRP